jgi:hypothetical protein
MGYGEDTGYYKNSVTTLKAYQWRLVAKISGGAAPENF